MRILNKGGRRDNQRSTFLGRFVSLTLAVPLWAQASLVCQRLQGSACLLSRVVQPCLTVGRVPVTPLESLGPSIFSLPPDLKGNVSSQPKLWLCMLGVGILTSFHFGKLHCDKSSHLFLLTRSQVGKPISADSTRDLGVYFCDRA